MKKLIIIPLMFVLIGLTNIVNASKNIPLTELNVLSLQKSVQDNLNLSLKFTDVWRYPKLDILRRQLDAYFCVFRLNDSDKPNGAIIYYMNDQNYISEIKILNYNKGESNEIIKKITDVILDLLTSPKVIEKNTYILIISNS